MTKQELIKALEPFDDDMTITIFKNGTIFLAGAYYHIYKDGEGFIVIHNCKPALDKIVRIE
uniref:Uncharacterized protein n=1 Tax=viral metagenome TaxID=1070528 RepID=A0A6M3LB93_9ZZZZ